MSAPESGRPPYRPFGTFRLLLALLVVCQHQLHLLPLPARETFYCLELGVVAVATFFVISGFVVAEAITSFYAGRAAAFLGNRVLRLLPCYLAALLLAAAVQAGLHAAGRFAPLDGALAGSPVRPAVLLSGLLEILPGLQPRYLLGQDFSLIPFAWTLRVESAFYAAAFLVCAATPRWRWSGAAAIAAGYAAFATFLVRGHGPQQLLYAPFFLFGIALFLWRRKPDRGSVAHVLLAGGCVLASFPLWMQRGHPVLAWQMPLLIGLVAAFVGLTSAAPQARWRRWDRRAGDLSYPLYVGHGAVLLLLAETGAPRGAGLYAAGLALSLLLAAFLHGLVERPVRHLRDRLRGTAVDAAQVPVPHQTRVLVFAGGGLAHTSGGVGTLLANLLEIWPGMQGAPVLRVVDTRGTGGRPSVRRFLAALGVLLGGGADLVHVHMTTRGSVLRKCIICVLARARGLRFIVHMHGADFEVFCRGMPRAARLVLGAVLRGAAAVIVLGAGWRDFIAAEFGVPPSRIVMLPNAVPLRASRPRDPAPMPEILFLGRIGARKGVPELIEALASPALRALPWHATIAGDGDATSYRARVRALGLAERIAFPGWLDRATADAHLARADLLVLPSHHEALPMAVLEALAAGVPVITTPVGAIPEYLSDGVSARFVAAGSVTELAAALAALLADPAARAALGSGGRAAFARLLSVEALAQRMAQLYREAAA